MTTRGYEFIRLTDLYDEDENGNIHLVKEAVQTKWFCRDLEMISDVEQVFNDKGNIRTKRTRVYHDKLGDRIVLGRYKDILEIVTKQRNKVGYGD